MALWFVLGWVVGTLNMATQWWTVSSLRPQRGNLAVALALVGVFLRILLAGSLLVVAFYQGIFHGLLAFAGLETARWGLAKLVSMQKLTWRGWSR